MTIHDLDTPCLVLEEPAFRENLLSMERHVRSAGKRLRPHAKTHKCSTIARAQVAAGAVGICVAKTSEALGLLAAGVGPVLITGPVVAPAKLRKLAQAVRRGDALCLVADGPRGADLLEEAAAEAAVRFPVLVDLDPGLGRTGVRAEDAASLARHIESKAHLELRGLQAYLGSAQHIGAYEARRVRSLGAMRAAQDVFRSLRAAGHRMDVFTGAGTGTFDIDVEVEDLTDLQAGSYALMDTQYLAVGSREDPHAFGHFQPALRVLSMVISSPLAGQVTVDAGLKSIYRDNPPPALPSRPDLSYEWFGDEYGKVRGPAGALPAIGDTLAIIPSHCDPTVNLHDRIHVVDGERVLDTWPLDLRGLSQ